MSRLVYIEDTGTDVVSKETLCSNEDDIVNAIKRLLALGHAASTIRVAEFRPVDYDVQKVLDRAVCSVVGCYQEIQVSFFCRRHWRRVSASNQARLLEAHSDVNQAIVKLRALHDVAEREDDTGQMAYYASAIKRATKPPKAKKEKKDDKAS